MTSSFLSSSERGNLWDGLKEFANQVSITCQPIILTASFLSNRRPKILLMNLVKKLIQDAAIRKANDNVPKLILTL